MSDLESQKKPATKVAKHNEKSWDYNVSQNIRWSIPVSKEEIAEARKGSIKILLSPQIPVPDSWLGNLSGKRVLGLASGGGQQGPLLAAAGAEVIVFDISTAQLKKDKDLAEEEGLNLKTIHGSADSLEGIEDNSIDLIINPVSNNFFFDLVPVWKECSRVLKVGGNILYAFVNPISYCFDYEKANLGNYQLKYPLPYSDMTSLNEKEKERFLRMESPLEFGHNLEKQIGELIKNGFSVTGFFEDDWDTEELKNKFFPTFINVKATKLP